MMTIYKYPIQIADELTLVMPTGAKILNLALQNRIPCLWALVDTTAPRVDRHFRWRGTGHSCEGLSHENYVGTVLLHEGSLVFHLFQVG